MFSGVGRFESQNVVGEGSSLSYQEYVKGVAGSDESAKACKGDCPSRPVK